MERPKALLGILGVMALVVSPTFPSWELGARPPLAIPSEDSQPSTLLCLEEGRGRGRLFPKGPTGVLSKIPNPPKAP